MGLIQWFGDLEGSRQAILLGVPLVFCALAPRALRWRGRRGLELLWLGVVTPLVPYGWHEWRAEFSSESPSLPLFHIAAYALPIGMAAASAAMAVFHSSHRRSGLAAQFGLALLAAYVPLPLFLTAGMLGAFVIYGLTGGFI